MIQVNDLHWAAGFLEGEGSFCLTKSNRGITVQAGQKQRQPLERLQRILGGTIYIKPPGMWQWVINGRPAIEIMMTLYALMSPRRQMQIGKVVEGWKRLGPTCRGKYKTVCCSKKHPWIPENIQIVSGSRRCKICYAGYYARRLAYAKRRYAARHSISPTYSNPSLVK